MLVLKWAVVKEYVLVEDEAGAGEEEGCGSGQNQEEEDVGTKHKGVLADVKEDEVNALKRNLKENNTPRKEEKGGRDREDKIKQKNFAQRTNPSLFR